MTTRPVTGRTSPEITPKSVDLPAPFGPTNPTMVPGGTSMETSDRAVSPPKRTVTPVAARTGSADAVGDATGSADSGKVAPDHGRGLLGQRDLARLRDAAHLVPEPQDLPGVLRHGPVGELGHLHGTEPEEDGRDLGVGGGQVGHGDTRQHRVG